MLFHTAAAALQDPAALCDQPFFFTSPLLRLRRTLLHYATSPFFTSLLLCLRRTLLHYATSPFFTSLLLCLRRTLLHYATSPFFYLSSALFTQDPGALCD